jgi:putative peptide zinc metalloprotease protein
VTAADVDQMLRGQLVPVGLVVAGHDDTAKPPAPTANPILALGLRGTVVPTRVVQAMARPLAFMFHPPVVVVVAVTLLITDIWLLRTADVMTGLAELIATPLLALPLALLSLLVPLIHEFGHAAGCHYSGGRPGRIGFGVFIVWPALFTDVTDAYRLSRAARIRTDLGGLYFTVLGLLGVTGLYAATGAEVLVLVVLTLHIQALQQLIPFVRTDGYYLLGDVSGVPNPFSSIVPVLRSALPRRPLDPSIASMRPATRRIITGWVLMVVPFLTLGLGLMVVFLPRALPRWVESIQTHASAVGDAIQTSTVLPGLYAALSLLMLMVPLLGGLIVGGRVARSLARRVARPTHASRRSS